LQLKRRSVYMMRTFAGADSSLIFHGLRGK